MKKEEKYKLLVRNPEKGIYPWKLWDFGGFETIEDAFYYAERHHKDNYIIIEFADMRSIKNLIQKQLVE